MVRHPKQTMPTIEDVIWRVESVVEKSRMSFIRRIRGIEGEACSDRPSPRTRKGSPPPRRCVRSGMARGEARRPESSIGALRSHALKRKVRWLLDRGATRIVGDGIRYRVGAYPVWTAAVVSSPTPPYSQGADRSGAGRRDGVRR